MRGKGIGAFPQQSNLSKKESILLLIIGHYSAHTAIKTDHPFLMGIFETMWHTFIFVFFTSTPASRHGISTRLELMIERVFRTVSHYQTSDFLSSRRILSLS